MSGAQKVWMVLGGLCLAAELRIVVLGGLIMAGCAHSGMRLGRESESQLYLEPMPTSKGTVPPQIMNRAESQSRPSLWLEWDYEYVGRDNGGFVFEVWHTTNLAEAFSLALVTDTNRVRLAGDLQQEFFMVRARDMWGQVSDWASSSQRSEVGGQRAEVGNFTEGRRDAGAPRE